MKRKAAFATVAVGAAMSGVMCPQLSGAHAPATTTVQFDREIVRILDDHCVMCHAEGGPSFPLLTYEQAYAARWQIRKDALARRMAPWAAVAGFGDFANDNGLTQREIDFLTSWAESFGPRNNGAVYSGIAAASSAPKAVQAHQEFDEWALGKPDLVLDLPATALAPEDHDAIRRVVIDSKLTSERWLRGFEYKPGARHLVHAVSFSVQESGQWLGGWTPWYGFMNLPATLSFRVPAGAHIVADIHYSTPKAAAVDRGTLGLYFASAPSARGTANLVLEPAPGAAAGGATRLAAAQKLSDDTNLLGIQPQLWAGIQSIEVAARRPDGTRQVLLFAKDIPLQWPTPYVFAAAVALPKGTELSVVEYARADAAAPTRGAPVTFAVYTGAALPPDTRKIQPAPVQPAAAPARHFKLTGTIKSVDAGAQQVLVQHNAIPGFMGAMTMSYDVSKREDLKKLAAGDQIESDVVVNDTDTYLENIKVTQPHK